MKTGDSQESVGSNPTLSANDFLHPVCYNRIVKFTLTQHGEVLKLAEEAPLLRA